MKICRETDSAVWFLFKTTQAISYTDQRNALDVTEATRPEKDVQGKQQRQSKNAGRTGADVHRKEDGFENAHNGRSEFELNCDKILREI